MELLQLLQAAAVYAALANGGKMIKPSLIKKKKKIMKKD